MRSFGMDVVRTVSIWMVLIAHIAYWFMPDPKGVYVVWITPLMLGVEPFFVLGGFLAAFSFYKVQKSETKVFSWTDVKEYWHRRWARTLPNYFLFLLVYFIAFSVFKEGFSFDSRYLFFLQNFFWLTPNFFSASWSLATQEWFYLLFPFVIFLFSSSLHKRSVLATCILFICFCLAFRMYFVLGDPFPSLEGFLRRVASLRMDSIVVGVLIGWLYFSSDVFLNRQKTWFIVGLVGIVVLAYLRRQEWFNSLGSVQLVFYPLFSLFIALTMPFFYELSQSGFKFLDSFVVATSKWSYSIYLCHVFYKDAMYLIIKKFGYANEIWVMFCAALVWLTVVYGTSALVYKKFEVPAMRYFYKR